MKIDGISNYLLADKLSYKGHGQKEHSSSSSSVGHVVSHELRHLREFENKAQAEGKEIRNKQIHVGFGFRNGRLVAVSGEATALLLDKKGSPMKDGENNKLKLEVPHTPPKKITTNSPDQCGNTKIS